MAAVTGVGVAGLTTRPRAGGFYNHVARWHRATAKVRGPVPLCGSKMMSHARYREHAWRVKHGNTTGAL